MFAQASTMDALLLGRRTYEIFAARRQPVLLRDIADVKRLRDEDGPNLLTQGSTELSMRSWLTTSSTR